MKLTVIAAFAALAMGGAAIAQEQAPAGGGQSPSPEAQAARQALRAACAADFQSLCEGKQGREAFMCLRENIDKASQGCKDAVAKMPRPGAPPAGGK